MTRYGSSKKGGSGRITVEPPWGRGWGLVTGVVVCLGERDPGLLGESMLGWELFRPP